MRDRRALAVLIASLMGASLLTGAAAAPDEGGVSPADPAPPATVELSGRLLVVPGEAKPIHAIVGQPTPEPEVSETTVTLVTDEGARVQLSGEGLVAAASDQAFTGTVTVPTEVAGDVRAEVVTQGLRLDATETAELVAEVAEAQGATLDVLELEVEVESTPPTARITTPHTLDVIWYGLPGMAPPSPANVDAAIARLGEFWRSQSGGQISAVTRPLPMKTQNVTWNICDESEAWQRGSAAFGHPDNSFYWTGTRARHLVVLVPDSACGGGGIANVGASIHAGGLILAQIPPTSPIDWDQVLFHEFGHNLGLLHSNLRECVDGARMRIDSAINPISNRPSDRDCSDTEYFDRYDVMGGAYTLYSPLGDVLTTTTRNIPALNATHAARIGGLTASNGLRSLVIADGDVQTVSLPPLSATSGTRALVVTDPRSGERVYVEYRSGTGRDAASMYATWQTTTGDHQFAPGVRVLRWYPNSPFNFWGFSTVLQRWVEPGPYDRVQWLGEGHSLTTYTGAITVAVDSLSDAAAELTLSFDDGNAKFTSRPTPTVQAVGGGAIHFGQTLQAGGAAPADWEPDATAVSYEWRRNGAPIPGATSAIYQVSGADVGQSLTVRATGTRSEYTPAAAVSAVATPTGPTTSRVWGATRYETAIEVSRRAFGSSTVPVVYLATGLDYPDALGAAAAAATRGGPLLLVPRTAASIPQGLIDRLVELAPARVVVVGGTGVIPPSVVDVFRRALPGVVFDRAAGADRYATSRALVAGSFSTASRVYIATGRDFPDALSASAVAGGRDAPVILVDGMASSLDQPTLALIASLGATQAIIVGGTGVVSSGIEAQLSAIYATARLAGADRYATSATINAASFPGAVPAHVWATGTGFADALAGAVLAAVENAPLYVVDPTCVPRLVAAGAGAKATSAVTLLGGTGALSENVAALGLCP